MVGINQKQGLPGGEPVFSERERFVEVWEMELWTPKKQGALREKGREMI